MSVAVRYAIDRDRAGDIARRLPANIGQELVEPVVDGVRQPVTARRIKWTDVQGRLERFAAGRMMLSGLRWAVVVALITTGYFTAAGIDSGITALQDSGASTAQPILAASTAHK